MGATRMGFFSREEFLGGMRSLRCDSVDSLCRACQQLDKEVRLSLSLFITIFLLSHYIYYLAMVLRSLARRDSVTFSASLSTFVAQARYLHVVTPTFHCCSSMREHLHSCRRA
jgi:hypothetical protein